MKHIAKYKYFLAMFLALTFSVQTAFALTFPWHKKKVILDAYDFYQYKALSSYADAREWDMEKFYSYTWESEDKDKNKLLMVRNTRGYQYESYLDIVGSLTKELEEVLQIKLEDGEDGESSFGKTTIQVPNYLPVAINKLSRLIQLALHEVGEAEAPPYSDTIKYNEEMGYENGIPWSASFLGWCVTECDLCDTFTETTEEAGTKRRVPTNNGWALTPRSFYESLTAKDYPVIKGEEAANFGGEDKEKTILPGDIVFWDNKDASGGGHDFYHMGVVSETGDDYVVVIQGNTTSGQVLPIKYDTEFFDMEAEKNEKAQAVLQANPNAKVVFGLERKDFTFVRPTYPAKAYNGQSVEDVIVFFLSKGFSRDVIVGILGNMDAESGVLPYRCEFDVPVSEKSSSYTACVDDNLISRDSFVYGGPKGESVTIDGVIYPPGGYGLVQFTHPPYKASLYDMAKKMGRSVADSEIQLILIEEVWSAKIIPGSQPADEVAEAVLQMAGKSSMNLFEMLLTISEADDGAAFGPLNAKEAACHLIMTYYEKPKDPNLGDRLGRGESYDDQHVPEYWENAQRLIDNVIEEDDGKI